MIRNTSALLVACILIFVVAAESAGQTSTKPQPSPAERAKTKVAKLGTGEKARAEIKLRTGEKLKGYISSAGENDFTITDKKTGHAKSLAYVDVDKVNKPGLSRRTKIIIVVAAVLGTAAILAISVVHSLNNLDFRGISVR